MPNHHCAPGHRTSHFSESQQYNVVVIPNGAQRREESHFDLSLATNRHVSAPNPQPPPSRCTQVRTPPAPNLQSPSPSYSSPTSPPTASAAHHSRLHSSHSSAKPSSPVSPSASSLAQSESSENVCKTISVFQSPHQSPWRLRHAIYLAVHAIPAWKIQRSPVSGALPPRLLQYLSWQSAASSDCCQFLQPEIPSSAPAESTAKNFP